MKADTIAYWTSRLLIAAICLGSLAVIVLWWLYATAKCESFGCLGLAWLLIFLVIIGSITSAVGGLLIRLYRRSSQDIPRWLYALMALNISPLIWLILRMLFTK